MAKGVVRRLTKRFFLILTFAVCGIFLCTALTNYITPRNWWPIGFLSLLLPYTIILLLFFIIFWLAAKPIMTLIPLTALALGWNQLRAVIATNLPSSFNIEKKDSIIRLVSWNVGSMYGLSSDAEVRKHSRTEIAAAVRHLEPDVICLQEFNNSLTQGPQADNIGLFRDRYPYYYFSKDYDKRNGFYQSGSIIFSKFPIIDSGKVRYPHPISESFIYADIVKNHDTFRCYNVHLQSFLFSKRDYQKLDQMADRDEQAIFNSKNIIAKMKIAFQRRAVQSALIRHVSDSCLYPNIICGDFNDVPASYTYLRIRGSRQDAFLARGFGIGRTYISLAPTLRIDYILPDGHFNIHQFDLVDEDLSDHLLLVSDMTLR